MVERVLAQVGPEEGLVHPLARDRGRQRQVAPGDALADAEQVGPDAAALGGEQRAGAAEPGGHLVDDDQDVMGLSRFDHPAHRSRIGDLDARRALHQRLEHEGGQLPGMAFDQGDRPVRPGRVVVARGPQGREAQRVEHVGAEASGAQGDRADGVAVIGAAEGEVARPPGDPLVAPELERDLEGLLDGRRAIGREQEVRAVDGHATGQRLGQLDRRHVAVAEQGRVRDAVELGPGRVVELGDVVTERRDPQRGDGVEVAAPVDIDQLAPLGPFDDDRGVVGIGRHLGEPVPHDRGVTGDPLVVGAHVLVDATALVLRAHDACSSGSEGRGWRWRRHTSIASPIGVDGGPSTNGQSSSASLRQLPVAKSSPKMA